MNSSSNREMSPPAQPSVYQIRIKGYLDQQWTDWFYGFSITLEDDGDTLLTGQVADQATLHGLIKKVRDLEFHWSPSIRSCTVVTIGGGAAFWVTTIATSLLPVAAEYRAAYSNWSVQTVWIDSLFVGMIIGGCISYSLLRCFEKTQKKDPELDHLPYPQKDSILKSVKFSSIALFAAVMLIDVPLCFHASEVAVRYLLIGVMFNAARFLILGFVISMLYKRLYGTN